MLIKVISSLLLLFVLYMGLKQGWAMFSGKPEMMDMFGKWNFNRVSIRITGVITILSALLILHPRTFFLGNLLMAATILLIICLQLSIKDIKGAVIEIPFLMLNLVLIYLQYPFIKESK